MVDYISYIIYTVMGSVIILLLGVVVKFKRDKERYKTQQKELNCIWSCNVKSAYTNDGMGVSVEYVTVPVDYYNNNSNKGVQ